MSRSTFTRLGDHIAYDRAADVRRRAAENPNDEAAQAELARSTTSPEALQKKVAEIVRAHLSDADATLGQAFPLATKAMAATQYADALLDWCKDARVNYEFDTPEGRSVEIVRVCAGIILGTSHGLQADDFNFGVVLGYQLASLNHLLVREFADGPALARERELARGRAEGGKARKDAAKQRRDEIAAEFMAAKRANSRISANGWAKNNAERFKRDPETVRKIAAEAQRKAKERPSTP